MTSRDTWALNLATRICLILGSLDNIFVLKFFKSSLRSISCRSITKRSGFFKIIWSLLMGLIDSRVIRVYSLAGHTRADSIAFLAKI